MRIIMFGHGRMGRLTEQALLERGHEVAAIVTASTPWEGELPEADAAIDYSLGPAVLPNAERCAAQGIPLVIGASDWYDRLPDLGELVHGSIPCLYSSNFSVGVYRFKQILAEACRQFAQEEGFDSLLSETHHRHKVDRPSGTARDLVETMTTQGKAPREVIALRVGEVPGTHEIVFDSDEESIILTHRARKRTMWSTGAVRAAEWLAQQGPGLYTMDDWLRRDVLCASSV